MVSSIWWGVIGLGAVQVAKGMLSITHQLFVCCSEGGVVVVFVLWCCFSSSTLVYFVQSLLFVFNMLVAPLLEGSWRYIGGGAIVFQAIKTYIFGKLVRYVKSGRGERGE